MGFWDVVVFLALGAVVGWLASKIMHGKGGLVRNIIVGVAGSVLGGWVASLLGLGSFATKSFSGFLVALGGSCLLIILSRLILGRR